MAFTIWIFNQHSVIPHSADDILAAITEAHYTTLCAQYGIDPDLIAPAQKNLRVFLSPFGAASFFVVHYQATDGEPVVVSWRPAPAGRETGMGMELPSVPMACRERLAEAQQWVSVELTAAQLKGFGLLVGYELARWAACQGQGLVRALDGHWYRMNAYKAFLPAETD